LSFDNASLRIVILSGPIGSGKTSLCQNLKDRNGAHIVRTRDLIKQQIRRVKEERGALQRAGERLEAADGGAWVKNALSRYIESQQTGSLASGLYIVDSVRIPGQVNAIREAFGSAVHHIHLTAAEKELEQRYLRRGTKTQEFSTYADVRKSRTERNVEDLAKLADVVVATDRCTAEAVLVRATALLGLYPRSTTPLVDVLVGGQYGS
jgi:adenylosuccinate synthase